MAIEKSRPWTLNDLTLTGHKEKLIEEFNKPQESQSPHAPTTGEPTSCSTMSEVY